MKEASGVVCRALRYANIPIKVNALLTIMVPFLLILSVSLNSTAAVTASLSPETPISELPIAFQQHAESNYHNPNMEEFAGLAGLTNTGHYYDGSALAPDVQPLGGGLRPLAETPYENYAPKAPKRPVTDFVPTSALSNYHNGQLPEYETSHQGKIDFVINRSNYGQSSNEAGADVYFQSYTYQPLPPLHDNIHTFPNYRLPAGVSEQKRDLDQSRQAREENALNLRNPRPTLLLPAKQKPHFSLHKPHMESTHELHKYYKDNAQEDQQLLYSQAEHHFADLPNNYNIPSSLPPITTTVHHTPSSRRAIAGVPLAKHVEITRHVPVTHYQKVHMPYKQPVQLRISRPVITTIPKPFPIKIPVSKTVAVPEVQEVKIPLEKVKPFPVERPIPFVVERRVPYRVEKPVATPIYYPYPVKVPVIRTVVHKQRPQYSFGSHGLGTLSGSNSPNRLLG